MVLGWTQHTYFRKRKFQKQQKFDDRRNKKLIGDACDNITKLYVHDVHVHYYKQTNYNNNKTKNVIQQTTDCKKQNTHTHNNKYT